MDFRICSPHLTVCFDTRTWQLNESMFDVIDHTCRSWTLSTPLTFLMDLSNAAMAMPCGVASMSTLTASVMMPHELRMIKPPMTSEITGSAMGLPVSATRIHP